MAIIKKDAYFVSSTGLEKIHCIIWQDDTLEPMGVFQIAHSTFEHLDRYDEFAKFLAESGLIVCGNDHLGHGGSVESEEDLGYISEKDGDLRLVDDMHILHNIMAKRYPTLPYFMFGHGFGSMCARVYASNFGDELSGLVLSGTGELPSAAVVVEKPLKFMCEKFGTKAEIPASIFDTLTNIGIKDKSTAKDWLTRDKQSVTEILLDPLCNFDFKLGGLRDIITLCNTACTDEWASLVPTSMQIMLISGAKDPIGFNGKGVINVCDNLEIFGHAPKVILYPGSRHNLLVEEEKQQVFCDVLEFLYSVGFNK